MTETASLGCTERTCPQDRAGPIIFFSHPMEFMRNCWVFVNTIKYFWSIFKHPVWFFKRCVVMSLVVLLMFFLPRLRVTGCEPPLRHHIGLGLLGHVATELLYCEARTDCWLVLARGFWTGVWLGCCQDDEISCGTAKLVVLDRSSSTTMKISP